MPVYQNNNDDWIGSWVEVTNVSVVPHDDNLLVCKSNHSFEIRNLTDKDLHFTVEYAHKLHEMVNGQPVDLNVHNTISGNVTVDARDEGEPMRVWTHVDQEGVDGWNTFRQMDHTGEDGKVYMLECYTAVRRGADAPTARKTDDTVL